MSSNSICQGQQASLFWKNIEKDNIKINFAYTTFKWNNESSGNAAVFCIIIGFSTKDREEKFLFTQNNEKDEIIRKKVLKINNYLIEEENIFIDKIQNPICNTKKCYFGNMPNDGGNFLITEKDRNQMTLMYPSSEKIIKRYMTF